MIPVLSCDVEIKRGLEARKTIPVWPLMLISNGQYISGRATAVFVCLSSVVQLVRLEQMSGEGFREKTFNCTKFCAFATTYFVYTIENKMTNVLDTSWILDTGTKYVAQQNYSSHGMRAGHLLIVYWILLRVK